MGYHFMRTRRVATPAISVAAFLIGLWLPKLALGAVNNVGLPVIPLHISNHFTTQHLFVWIFGVTNQVATGIPKGTNVYATDKNGDVAINPAIPAAKPRSLGIPVGNGTSIDLNLPKLSGIRIYTSLGAGLLTQNGGIRGNGLATPDVENPGDPNFKTIFDSIETTWEDQAPIPQHPEIKTNLGTNVTEVDLFGLVQQYTVAGTDPATFKPNTTKTAGFLSTTGRETLFKTLQGLGLPWSKLILKSGDNDLRVVSPNHGIHGNIAPFPLFPSDQLKAYINNVFTHYTTAKLKTTVVVAQPGGLAVTYNFAGSTAGGEFFFSDPTKNGGKPIFSLAKWSTFNAYEGHFPLGTVKPGGKECIKPPLSNDCLAYLAVGAKLQGAVMRTDLLVNNNLDACVKSQFYVNAPVNEYSKLWHDKGIGGRAYGFGFDDTCDQSSFQLIFNPTKLTITLPGSRP
jgi:hypothetical protein